MQTLKTTIRAGHQGKEAEILLYEEIGYWGITTKMFADELKALGKVDHITVGIGSDGGDAFDGMNMYNALVRHPASVTTRIDSIAASAASLVAMAGDRIEMADNAWMMIHAPWAVTAGNGRELHEIGDLLISLTDDYIDTYANRRGIDRAEVDRIVWAETWMHGSEVVDAGFADEVLATPAIAASIATGRYRHTPAALLDTKAVYVPPPPKWRVAASQRDRDLTLAQGSIG